VILTLVAKFQITIVGLTLGKLMTKSDQFFLLVGLCPAYFIGLLYMGPRLLQEVGLNP
jgi:hypothetical protein